jgi:spore coat protein U-like protein
MSFGTYDPSSSTPLYTNTTIDLHCEEHITAIISIDAGENAGIGNFQNRILQSGSYTLEYNLYIDASCTKVWGDGTNNTYTKTNHEPITIYGKITPHQRVIPGNYIDRVTITIVW